MTSRRKTLRPWIARLRRPARRMSRGSALGDPVPPPVTSAAEPGDNQPDLHPFEAGLVNLRRAAAAAEAAGLKFLVNPNPNGISYRLVLRAGEVGEFWGRLAASPEAQLLRVRWKPAGRRRGVTMSLTDAIGEELADAGSVLLFSRLLTNRRGPTPASESGCTVEAWVPEQTTGPDGGRVAWAAPVNNNPRSSLISWEPSDVTSLGAPVAGMPTVAAFRRDAMLQRPFPIDAVYLWVDGSDPQWQARRDRIRRTLPGATPSDATSEARFRQQDELRYSLRSLEYFAPWIRRVFVVTDRQQPRWLDPETATVVDHREIWPDPNLLPTYNSRALASRIHHIPGLAESFLLINDDVFLGSPTLPRHWFDPSGRPLFHNTASTLPDPALLPVLPSHIHARYNSLRLIADRTGYHPTRLFQHGPIAQSRSWCSEVEDSFPEEHTALLRSPFRSTTDIEPIWLRHYLGYALGRAAPGSLSYAYLDISDAGAADRMAPLLQHRNKQVFCLNDTEGATAETMVAMGQFLDSYFPVPSRFERADELP